jgi:thiol:disulfide interchange protein DsbG
MVEAWRARQLDGSATAGASQSLALNMAAAQAIGLKGTPTFVWRKTDGTEARSDGLPADLSELIASIGGQP